MAEPPPPPEVDAPQAPPAAGVLAAVAAAGFSTMAVELATGRLLAPYAGTTLIAWTLLIGAVLVAMSLGAWLGGRRADSLPDLGWPHLERLLLVAGGLVLAIPFLGEAMLKGADDLIHLLRYLLAVAGLVASVGLPAALLGATLPYATRILARGGRDAGAAAGRAWAAHAAGSLAGVFLSGLVLLPGVGAKRTFLLAGALLLGVVAARGRRLAGAVTLVVLAIGWGLLGPLKVGPGLVHAEESSYHFIQVYDDRFLGAEIASVPKDAILRPRPGAPLTRRFLVLDEGFAFHSIHDPDGPAHPFVGAYYDFLGVLPFLLDAGKPLRALAIGTAGATAPQQWVHLFGAERQGRPGIVVDGVEIDGRLIEVAREHMGVAAAEATGMLRCYPEDGRLFLRRRPEARYDLAVLDVYRQPYIPFHLATREFFELLAEHLEPGGLVAMNVVLTHIDSDLFVALASTVKAVFPHTWYMDVITTDGETRSALLLASKEHPVFSRLDPGANPEIARVAAATSAPMTPQVCGAARAILHRFADNDPTTVFRDDHAAVEYLSQKMFVEALSRAAQKLVAQQKAEQAAKQATP